MTTTGTEQITDCLTDDQVYLDAVVGEVRQIKPENRAAYAFGRLTGVLNLPSFDLAHLKLLATALDQAVSAPADDSHAVRTQRHGRGAASSHARVECSCGWRGELMPIKTVEGWALADRDGERHLQAVSAP